MATPSQPLVDLLADARLFIETIESSESPIFRRAAADLLSTIAKEMSVIIQDEKPA